MDENMKRIKAKDMLHQNYKRIFEDETISKALSLLEETKVLLVFEDENFKKYKGVLTEKNINKSFLDPETKIKKIVLHAPRIKGDDDIIKISKLMFENDILQLPVFEDEKIIGVVDDTEILKKLKFEIFSEKKVKDFMTKNLFTIREDETISRALSLMRKKRVTRLPVVEGEKLLGLLTLHDIIEHIYKPKERFEAGNYFDEKVSVLDLPVKNLMVKNVVTVKENSSVKEVISLMLEYTLNSIIVVDEVFNVKGIITRKDLLELLTSFYEDKKGIFIQLVLRDDESKSYKEDIVVEVENFIKKWDNLLGEGTLTLDVQKHKEKFRKLPLIYSRLRIITDKIKIVVSTSGFGYEQSVKNVLKKAEEEFFKYKEINKNIPKKKIIEFLELYAE